ncbi:glycosyltransferase [Nocardioides jejuensis]|uniref:Glycosyltransferase n=1 Tax=Nocardioides jejuensis TaxID=2502782 RepID=A0A4R1CG67_9ACTN|nr:glycosyltransferase [Nocardioides jejuensis]TCJ30210.1 glycosyltransferase [Nocardioides jejuensis]
MKVGIRVSPQSSGGGVVFVENLTRSLRADPRCSEVAVFVMGESTRYDAENQIEVPVSGGSISRRLRGDRALARTVADHPVDVILCPGNEISQVPGTPSLLWPLTVAPFEEPAMRQLGRSAKTTLRWKVLRKALGAAVSKSDALIFSSHYTRGLYSSHFPALRERPSVVVPPPPSLTPDAADVPTPDLPDDYILYVSHMYPYKMVLEMIRGYAEATRRGVTHKLVIAGRATNASYGAEIERVIDEEGVADKIVLLGSLPAERLPYLYRRATLFLFPSISENAGSFALLDAFIFGVPVLSSSSSSMPEACRAGAAFFDPRDIGQLTEELVRILGDEAELRSLAARSAARGQELRYWDAAADQVLTFCSSLVAGRRA